MFRNKFLFIGICVIRLSNCNETSDEYDSRASFSNWGSCIDWFAPGVNIYSSGNDSDTDEDLVSGTSFSSPFSAGIAAIYLEQFPAAEPWELRNDLYNFTTKDIIGNADSYNDHLLYSLVSHNEPPAADFTHSDDCRTVHFTDQGTDTDGTVEEWSWDFGDGTTSPYQNPTHIYNSGGTYGVDLKVTDNEQAQDVVSKIVKIRIACS